jgi:putative ABC transport system permease protein
LSVVTEPEVTIPLTAEPLVTRATLDRLRTSDSRWVSVVGRLRRDASIDTARAQLETIRPEIMAASVPPGLNGARREEFLATRLSVESGARGSERYLRPRFGPALYAIGGVAMLVFAIAIINVAGLAVTRTSQRMREVRVRLAIGASRWRVARQMLIEGSLVCVVGAVAGLILAYWVTVHVSALIFEQWLTPASLDVRPDARVIAFAIVGALLAVALFTLMPILWTIRHDTAEYTRSGARTVRGASHTGRVMIAGQIAICFAMLTLAALLVRTVHELRSAPVGYRSDDVLAMGLYPIPGGYRDIDLDSYYATLLERVRATPAVATAALTAYQPGAGFVPTRVVYRPGEPAGVGHTVLFGQVTNSFFDTLGLPILRGRDFSGRDSASSGPVGILSRSLAERLFQKDDPIGQTVSIGDPRQGERVQIVGVVPDTRLYDAKHSDTAALYIPLTQQMQSALYTRLLVRTSEGSTLVTTIREAVRALGREQIIYAGPLNEMREGAILQERLASMSGACFAAIALLLAAVGLYGLVAFTVSQRTNEIGVRMALGAAHSEVLQMIGRDAIRITVTGIMIGAPLALATSWAARALFFGVQPGDPWTMALAAGVLVCVSIVAAIRPAQRAAAIDPMSALRAE